MSATPEKSVIIIGAGVAGLAAGCYAQMNGYRSHIFELHDIPGGLCTAWERKGYIFDGCIHYLFGSGEGQAFNPMWQELGVLEGRHMIHHTEYQRISDGQHTLIVYADPTRLEAHMKQIAPEDAPLIEAFCDGVRQFGRFDMSRLYRTPKPMLGLFGWMKLGMSMLPFLPVTLRWALLPMRAFGQRFKNPFLRRAVPLMFSWDEAPAMMGMCLLAYISSGNAAFPAGGSLEFARALERRYLELGGQISYQAQVEKILREDGAGGDRACGVRLYNDEVHHADTVISAADGHCTIFDMLDGQYVNRGIRRRYDGHLPMYTQVQISLGVKRDMSAEPHWVTYLLDDPLLIIGEERREIGIKNYCFDPGLAPAGKSVMMAMIRSDYHYWQHLQGRRVYDTEQTQVSDIVIDFLEKLYPGIRADVEVVDEATPLSYERYTSNWLGSTSGWLLSRETLPMLIMGVDHTLPRLHNFYMAGQWTEPGGMVPLVAASARNVIQMMCRADGKRFTAGKPS